MLGKILSLMGHLSKDVQGSSGSGFTWFTLFSVHITEGSHGSGFILLRVHMVEGSYC